MFAYVAWFYDSDLWEWYIAISFAKDDYSARVKPIQCFRLTEMHKGERFKKMFPGAPIKIQLRVSIS